MVSPTELNPPRIGEDLPDEITPRPLDKLYGSADVPPPPMIVKKDVEGDDGGRKQPAKEEADESSDDEDDE